MRYSAQQNILVERTTAGFLMLISVRHSFWHGWMFGLIALLAACDQSPQDTAMSLHNRYYNQYTVGAEALEDRDFQAAIDAYSEILAEQPDNADAYARRAYAYYQSGDDEAAAQDFEAALNIEPNLARAHAGVAVLYASTGKQPEALRHAVKAGALVRRQEADIAAMLGRAYYWLKDYEAALTWYAIALEADPGLFQGYSGRGLVYTALGYYGNAAEDFQAALNIREDYGLYNNLAVLADQLGHYDQAITYFHNAVALNSDFAVGYANLGLAYINLWDFESAEAQCQKSLSLDEYNCAAHYCLGRIYKASDDEEQWEQALRHYTQVLAYGCEYFNENYIANAYILRGQVKDALAFPYDDIMADFQAAIEHDPRHTYAYLLLGDLSRAAKTAHSDDDAFDYYTQAIRLTPNYAAAYIQRGTLYEERQEWQLARADFEKAAELAVETSWQQTAARHLETVQARLQGEFPVPAQPVNEPAFAPSAQKGARSLAPDAGQPPDSPMQTQQMEDVPVQMLEDIP